MSSIALSEVHAVRQAAHEKSRAADVSLKEYLSFRIASEAYGIDILQVQEIRSYEAPMRLPGAPAGVVGVINLRGVIVPVVDLRIHFGSAAHVDRSTVVIVLNIAGSVIGAVVDAVTDVVELSPVQIKPCVGPTCFTGIATIESPTGGEMLILLDIAHLMPPHESGLGIGRLLRETPYLRETE